NPKGVVYTHRSSFLHTLGVRVAGTMGIDEPDRVLPVVPMFHANAWGLAHAAVASGASLVMPGPDLSPGAGGGARGVGAGQGGARGADDLDGSAPRARRPRHEQPPQHRVRRLGGA